MSMSNNGNLFENKLQVVVSFQQYPAPKYNKNRIIQLFKPQLNSLSLTDDVLLMFHLYMFTCVVDKT